MTIRIIFAAAMLCVLAPASSLAQSAATDLNTLNQLAAQLAALQAQQAAQQQKPPPPASSGSGCGIRLLGVQSSC